MSSATQTKSPVDIWIERLDERLMKDGFGKTEWGNKTGSFIYIPPKDSPVHEIMKKREAERRAKETENDSAQ